MRRGTASDARVNVTIAAAKVEVDLSLAICSAERVDSIMLIQIK
jgi:hypothetical protein